MYQQIKYFKGLNGLRFIAALLVVIHHGEQIRMKYGLFNLKSLSICNLGGFAVTFFFVLSGFLITYLLLSERYQSNRISVWGFYKRRMLRIWPLYFLLVVTGLFLVPMAIAAIGYDYTMPYRWDQVILYYLLFAPFMVNILFGHSLLEPLWSIGVEELFYLIWGPAMSWVKKHVCSLLVSVIAIKLLINGYIYLSGLSGTLTSIVQMLQFEAMAIGGLGAYLLFNQKSAIENCKLFAAPVQIASWLIIIIQIVPSMQWIHTPVLWPVIVNIAFVYLIINISTNPQSLIRLESKPLNFLGSISYGIYMYHMICVFAVILLLKGTLSEMGNIGATLLFYLTVLLSTITVAYLSKRYYEDFFLKMNPHHKPIAN